MYQSVFVGSYAVRHDHTGGRHVRELVVGGDVHGDVHVGRLQTGRSADQRLAGLLRTAFTAEVSKKAIMNPLIRVTKSSG